MTVIEEKLVKEEEEKAYTLEESIDGIPKFAGFEKEEAIWEALKCFLAAIVAEWFLLEAVRSAKEFEVMRWASAKPKIFQVTTGCF